MAVYTQWGGKGRGGDGGLIEQVESSVFRAKCKQKTNSLFEQNTPLIAGRSSWPISGAVSEQRLIIDVHGCLNIITTNEKCSFGLFGSIYDMCCMSVCLFVGVYWNQPCYTDFLLFLFF